MDGKERTVVGTSCVAITVTGNPAERLDRLCHGGLDNFVAESSLMNAQAKKAEKVISGVDGRYEHLGHGEAEVKCATNRPDGVGAVFSAGAIAQVWEPKSPETQGRPGLGLGRPENTPSRGCTKRLI